MSESNPIDAKALVDVAKTAKEILPQTVTETDSAVSTLVGWFNNVVLYPVKKANITYRYKLECFEDDLRKKVDLIPDDKICSPNLMIAGPTLEALKYVYDEDDLREMFVNLLASSMNSDKVSATHPSFVDVIKQMNSTDAQLFKHLYLTYKNLNVKAVFPSIEIVGQGKYFASATPSWFFDWVVPGCDIFQTSTSLIRLGRLGLVELMFDRTAGKDGYEELKNAPILKNILERYQKANPNMELAINTTDNIFYINEFGIEFGTSCL